MAKIDSEFSRLLHQRDLEAHAVVGTLKGALAFWEAQDFEATRGMLLRAIARFDEINARLDQASTSTSPHKPVSSQENTSHGNRSIA